MRYTVIAYLYANNNNLAALQGFEKKALPLLTAYNGRLEYAFAPDPKTTAFDDTPDEVHILSFPSEAAFTAYREDPQHQALSEERAQAIRKTRIIAGHAVASYPQTEAATDAHR